MNQQDPNTTQPDISSPVSSATPPYSSSQAQPDDKYQQILEEYSSKINTNPEPQPQHPLPPSYPPQVEASPQPEQNQSHLTDKTPSGKFNFFKYLFYLSTLTFVVILVLLVKDYIRLQQLSQTSIPSPIPVEQSEQPTEN